MDDLDRWTRVLPLGSGAFGEVHLAWDRVDGCWVACKRFTGQDELGLLRMVIESRIRVSHPHLVRTLAFRLADDQAWLITELARGGSLRALITRTGALPWGWVAEAVDQILAALAALHATGVVHRDLKPANLLLRSYGPTRPHLLVGDFGIATWRTVSMTGVGAAIGTPGYLAPEYLDGHQPSPATDLFAVGVLAAELLSGRRLVHYSNASPTMPSSWRDQVPVPPDVPPRLTAVLQRLADPDPTRRYTDSTQAREALLAACPPGSRGDLTTVVAADLLASVPPGWTPEGPEQSTTELPSAPAEALDTEHAPLNLVGLPIDGGATVLTQEHQATLSPNSPPPQLAAPASGSSTQPPTGSSTQPPSGSATSPAPTGSSTRPPSGSATSAKAGRTARRRRRFTRVVLLVVVLAFAGGAGTLWWAANHRTLSGQPSASGASTSGPVGASRWEPTLVEPCSRVERTTVRQGRNGRERCQRTPNGADAQHWVEEPATGFPKSNADGPFPGESCTADGDKDYSPVGDHVICEDGTWQIIT
ncbi:serine/threonine protein kinase [Actinophytocola sp.]|uniref:serine/threonine protein kinase n=1 Tax=Actinophytocola sp. TaxID=1872138 RepID=UPI002ED1738C